MFKAPDSFTWQPLPIPKIALKNLQPGPHLGRPAITASLGQWELSMTQPKIAPGICRKVWGVGDPADAEQFFVEPMGSSSCQGGRA